MKSRRLILLARTIGLEEQELGRLGEAEELLRQRFEQINAAAEIRLQLECTACHSRLWLDLDMARFASLREIADAAHRLMRDIHMNWPARTAGASNPSRP